MSVNGVGGNNPLSAARELLNKLGIKDPTEEQLREVMRTLAGKSNPDKGLGIEREEEFAAISKAKLVVTDELWEEYMAAHQAAEF